MSNAKSGKQLGAVLSHKRSQKKLNSRHGVFEGITSASGLMHNQTADNQLSYSQAQSKKKGNSSAAWVYGVTKPDNFYEFQSKDLQTDKIILVVDKENNVIKNKDIEDRNLNFSKLHYEGKRLNDMYELKQLLSQIES